VGGSFGPTSGTAERRSIAIPDARSSPSDDEIASTSSGIEKRGWGRSSVAAKTSALVNGSTGTGPSGNDGPKTSLLLGQANESGRAAAMQGAETGFPSNDA
jgi:hypothetical protein